MEGGHKLLLSNVEIVFLDEVNLKSHFGCVGFSSEDCIKVRMLHFVHSLASSMPPSK